jgi:hypothetical protein
VPNSVTILWIYQRLIQRLGQSPQDSITFQWLDSPAGDTGFITLCGTLYNQTVTGSINLYWKNSFIFTSLLLKFNIFLYHEHKLWTAVLYVVTAIVEILLYKITYRSYRSFKVSSMIIIAFFFSVLGMESRALGMLDKHSAWELYPQVHFFCCLWGFIRDKVSICRPVAQVGLKLSILLSHPPECYYLQMCTTRSDNVILVLCLQSPTSCNPYSMSDYLKFPCTGNLKCMLLTHPRI